MTGFRRNVTPSALTPEDFIAGAKTAEPLAPPKPRTVKATPAEPRVVSPTPPQEPQVPELNPRVMRQVNIDVPETLHHDLRSLVDTMPKMSMRKFILEAVAEKMERVRAGRSDQG